MMVNTDCAALKNRKITFYGIRMNIAPHILANPMIDHSVFLELPPQAFGSRALISHNKGYAKVTVTVYSITRRRG